MNFRDLRSYKAIFIVTLPNGEKVKAIRRGESSIPCSVTFPEDFGSETRGARGISKWSAFVNNSLAGYGEFEYRDVDGFLDLLTVRRNGIQQPATLKIKTGHSN